MIKVQQLNIWKKDHTNCLMLLNVLAYIKCYLYTCFIYSNINLTKKNLNYRSVILFLWNTQHHGPKISTHQIIFLNLNTNVSQCFFFHYLETKIRRKKKYETNIIYKCRNVCCLLRPSKWCQNFYDEKYY